LKNVTRTDRSQHRPAAERSPLAAAIRRSPLLLTMYRRRRGGIREDHVLG